MTTETCTHRITLAIDERWNMVNGRTWNARQGTCRCCGGPRIIDDFDVLGRPLNTGFCSYCREEEE